MGRVAKLWLYVEISFKLYNWRSKLLIFLILTGHIFFDRRASALVFLLLCTLYVSVQFRETTKFLLSYNFSQDISKLLVDTFLKMNMEFCENSKKAVF